jgi:hypothetical protein
MNILKRPETRIPRNTFHYNNFGPSYWIVDAKGCWLWQGIINADGYGIISKNGVSVRAHRENYERYFKIKIPKDKIIDHKCNTRRCVNPEHLELSTTLLNNRRAITTKLDMEKARAIRKEYIFGETRMKDIGLKYGVHMNTIKDILDNKTWKEQ